MAESLEALTALVTELQGQIAFQEDAIAKLDEALGGQQQEILLLKRQIELLQARHEEFVAQAEAGVAAAPAEEKPPHY